MSQFKLKSLDGPDQELSLTVGWDGDISLTIWDYDERFHQMIPHTVRIGMGGNSGDPNSEVKDIKYLKAALVNLSMEFKYQNGEISEEEITRWRNLPKVRPFEEKYFID